MVCNLSNFISLLPRLEFCCLTFGQAASTCCRAFKVNFEPCSKTIRPVLSIVRKLRSTSFIFEILVHEQLAAIHTIIIKLVGENAISNKHIHVHTSRTFLTLHAEQFCFFLQNLQNFVASSKT